MSLTTPSWPSTARLTNSTFSCTGDLGTESGLAQVKTDLVSLFGDWIEKPQDAGAEDSDAGEGDEGAAFEFEQEDPGRGFEMAPEDAGAEHAVHPAVPEPHLAYDDQPMPPGELDIDLRKFLLC